MPLHDWTQVESGIFHAFHTAWIGEIQTALNGGVLPDGYYALAEQHVGQMVTGVLTLHTPPSREGLEPLPRIPETDGGVTVADAPPQVSRHETLENTVAELRRTLTIRHVSRHRVVALLEIISPANKDRAEHVESFAVKNINALERGIHVLLVDLFPNGPRDPHGMNHEIRRRFYPEIEATNGRTGQATLNSWAVGRELMDVYTEYVELGDALPDMPLFLTDQRYVNVPLESTYAATWQGMPRFWRDVLEGREPG